MRTGAPVGPPERTRTLASCTLRAECPFGLLNGDQRIGAHRARHVPVEGRGELPIAGLLAQRLRRRNDAVELGQHLLVVGLDQRAKLGDRLRAN